jgi:tetratricopeptide (TPR) repeat protein
MGHALVAGLLLLAIFVAWYDSGRVSQALGSLRHPEISTATRRQIAADALHMAMARPLLGWGFGTFAWIYPQFRSFYTNLPIHAAHDDFAQALAELGFLGFAAITWLLVIVFRRASRRLKDWEADSASCAQLASAIGAGALLLHGLSDFNMQVPANAAMFFALCAITCAGRNHDFSARQPGKFASAVLVLAALLFAVTCGISFREQQLARTWEPARLVRAAQFNRFDAQPWLRLGYLELNAADSEAAALDLARAAQLNPHDARTWLELAQAHSALADDAGAKHSLDVAVSYAPTTPTNLAVAAGLYFQIGERQAGLAQLRALTENSPDLVPASVELAWRATHDVEIVLQKVAARNVDAQFALLQVLIEHDDLASAKRVWAQIHREHPTLNARQAFSYLQFLIEKNDGSEAEAVWRAVTAQPAYAAYRGDEGRLVNGGFESGVLNAGLGWRYQEAQGVKVFLDPSVAHGGKQSLALAFHGEVAETGMMQYVPVKPNANYHLGGFFQSKQLDGAGGLQWQIIENGTGTLLGATPTLTEADSWEEFGADFDTGPKTQIVVLRLVRMPEGNVLEGKVWFDDLSLASKPSAIGNGSRKH